MLKLHNMQRWYQKERQGDDEQRWKASELEVDEEADNSDNQFDDYESSLENSHRPHAVSLQGTTCSITAVMRWDVQ